LRHPGLAVGVEDVEGTRRFHSAYAVAGMPLEIQYVRSRVTLGYAFRAFTASRYVLDGCFGALEASPWNRLAAQLEFDSEKWNAGLQFKAPFGFRVRADLLGLTSLSAGVGWQRHL